MLKVCRSNQGYLTGDVDSPAQAKNAVKLARSIKGVKSVDSKLEVKTTNG